MPRKKKKTTAASNNKDPLSGLRDNLRKQFGDETIINYSESRPHPTVSTGVLALDRALGGGVPRGRMTELYGENSSGKTTLALSIVASAQKEFPDKTCVYIDAEHAFDSGWAEKLGVDLTKFEHVEPEFGEDAIFIMEAYLSTGNCSVIVLDSVAALLPKKEGEGNIGDANIGLQARLVASSLKRINRILNKYSRDSVLLFINQKRAQIAGGPASFRFEPSKTTGGKALAFYMTTRLPIVAIQRLKGSDDSPLGQVVKVDVLKNKVNTGPGKSITFRITNKDGIDTAHELLEFAEQNSLLTKAGSWFTFADTEEKAQGEENAKQIIKEKYFSKWKKLATS
jgi:recombination protein RecA